MAMAHTAKLALSRRKYHPERHLTVTLDGGAHPTAQRFLDRFHLEVNSAMARIAEAVNDRAQAEAIEMTTLSAVTPEGLNYEFYEATKGTILGEMSAQAAQVCVSV